MTNKTTNQALTLQELQNNIKTLSSDLSSFRQKFQDMLVNISYYHLNNNDGLLLVNQLLNTDFRGVNVNKVQKWLKTFLGLSISLKDDLFSVQQQRIFTEKMFKKGKNTNFWNVEVASDNSEVLTDNMEKLIYSLTMQLEKFKGLLKSEVITESEFNSFKGYVDLMVTNHQEKQSNVIEFIAKKEKAKLLDSVKKSVAKNAVTVKNNKELLSQLEA